MVAVTSVKMARRPVVVYAIAEAGETLLALIVQGLALPVEYSSNTGLLAELYRLNPSEPPLWTPPFCMSTRTDWPTCKVKELVNGRWTVAGPAPVPV